MLCWQKQNRQTKNKVNGATTLEELISPLWRSTVSMEISLITRLSSCFNGNMDKETEEENAAAEFKYKSRPVTAGGGIQNGIRFFTTAMNALDRIEGLLSEIEQTRTLVHQMMGEFSLAGRRVRISPEPGKPKKVRHEKKELNEKDAACAARSDDWTSLFTLFSLLQVSVKMFAVKRAKIIIRAIFSQRFKHLSIPVIIRIRRYIIAARALLFENYNQWTEEALELKSFLQNSLFSKNKLLNESKLHFEI